MGRREHSSGELRGPLWVRKPARCAHTEEAIHSSELPWKLLFTLAGSSCSQVTDVLEAGRVILAPAGVVHEQTCWKWGGSHQPWAGGGPETDVLGAGKVTLALEGWSRNRCAGSGEGYSSPVGGSPWTDVLGAGKVILALGGGGQSMDRCAGSREGHTCPGRQDP